MDPSQHQLQPGGQVPSPGSDISPKSSVPPQAPDGKQPGYFPKEVKPAEANTDGKTSESGTATEDRPAGRRASVSFVADLPRRPSKEGTDPVKPRADSLADPSSRRKSSTASVTFRQTRNVSLPQGNQKPLANTGRVRDRSPAHDRFQHHVAFDNVPNGDATKWNTPSLTLNVRHKGYQRRRRSRTFMVGVDEHAYSDYAVQWLLDELVDDGDEVVCVRVIEKDVRLHDKQYQDEAQAVMQAILAKNGSNRALSFVLEYSIGKLHATFQKLISMYEPAMLIVGTRGRSLGGIQGLMNTRNSFSKYCLQYSPVPVVVVRPTEKRIKKKAKRANDASRQTYIGMLSATQGRHEADSEASSTYELEVKISADEEAHQVAKVLGLPAKFDPTIRPLATKQQPRTRSRSPNHAVRQVAESPESQRTVNMASVAGDSDEDEEEEDGEFEVMSGLQALEEQKKAEQLHKMELGEAAALKMRVDNDDESDSDDSNEQKGAS